MMTRSEAVAQFLTKHAHPDLSIRYRLGMECQVNVAQDAGDRISGDYRGRKWQGFSDGLETWKSFRIPYNANKVPTYDDRNMTFDFATHVEAIGMTGWDWENLCSRWVAYDFDAIVGHESSATRLTKLELDDVRKAAEDIPWVTLRKSTSGRGLHLYVSLDAVHTENHNEHAALARSILGMMSALVGYDFESRVDICGSNMWVWHRKIGESDGLDIIKEGGILKNVPSNWKDHLNVIQNKRQRTTIDEICGQQQYTELDPAHKDLVKYFEENGCVWWWDQDKHMLVTHTTHVAKAFEDLKMKGFFQTETTGGSDHNCFLFPMRNGAWSVRRFTRGVNEHASWDQDGSGWTRCYLNKTPNLITAAKAYGGLEQPKGGFVFREAEIAQSAARLLGVDIQIDSRFSKRRAVLKEHKDGRLIITLDKESHDTHAGMEGWLPDKEWTKIYNAKVSDPSEPEDVGNFDDMVRHIVTVTNEDYGWMIQAEGAWRQEPLTHVKHAMLSIGLDNKAVTNLVGASVFKCWTLVNQPFQPEYPGDRKWNRNSAQLKFQVSQGDDLQYKTWLGVLSHCGSGLNDAVAQDTWCKANGILYGRDYLKCWIASLFQKPKEPLPYLFFHGEQNCGKSIFHEALSLLLTNGYRRADAAITSQGGFNAELEGAIICVIEETDLSEHKIAYNRIKDWVTSRELLIHPKFGTPYHATNTTHWIQCSNSATACPSFAGDTRITMIRVPDLDPLQLIPKRKLIEMLEAEASDFLGEIMRLELPESPDRLNIPILDTSEKLMMQRLAKNPFDGFLQDSTSHVPGRQIKFSELYAKFIESIDMIERGNWSKTRIGKLIQRHPYVKGRNRKDAQWYVGNIAWTEDQLEPEGVCTVRGEYMEVLK